MIDFTRFWDHVVMYILFQRLQIVFDIAKDETFAARVFKAYTGAGRCELIVKILARRGNEPLVVNANGE